MATKYRIRNPIMPSSTANPAGSTAIMAKADKDAKSRYARILDQVLAAFARVPFYALNADEEDYRVAYAASPEAVAILNSEIGYIIAAELTTGAAQTFWYSQYDRDAYRTGTALASANLSKLSDVYASSRPLSSVLNSPAYQNRIGFALQKSYAHWTGLADTLKAELSQIIAIAVKDGTNPRRAAALISDRVGASMSKARQYAQTDITDALRQARWAEADATEDELGIEIRLLWTSALKPTTREWHASRHGKTYTTKEVRDFYSRDGNLYRCYCAITEVLIQDGKPMLTQSLKDKMTTERAQFTSSSKR